MRLTVSIAAALFCFAFIAPASAQFTGGVFVAAGDVDSASAAEMKSRLSSAKMQFQASTVTFGAARSAAPPAGGGPGIAHVRVIDSSSAQAARWFRRGPNGRAMADGQDLLIVNDSGGSDIAGIVFEDIIISSYQTGGSGGSSFLTFRYNKIVVKYTVQADDHAAN